MSKPIGLRKSISYLERGSRLMIMNATDGKHFYIVPGGRVEHDTAQKIIDREDVIVFDDGLFPGSPQSWKISR